MKAKEVPRTTAEYSGDYYSEDDSSYDSEESSSESSPSSSKEHYRVDKDRKDHVLVVAGCKSCLMYFMVPKHVEDCPKCCGQLLHFDRSENGSPWMRFLIWFFFSFPWSFSFNILFLYKNPFVLLKSFILDWWNGWQMGFSYLFSVCFRFLLYIVKFWVSWNALVATQKDIKDEFLRTSQW